jgi:hypothetical protein
MDYTVLSPADQEQIVRQRVLALESEFFSHELRRAEAVAAVNAAPDLDKAAVTERVDEIITEIDNAQEIIKAAHTAALAALPPKPDKPAKP